MGRGLFVGRRLLGRALMTSLFVLMLSSLAWGQSVAIQNGLNWLTGQQAAEGNWPGADTSDFVASSAASDALLLHAPGSPAYPLSLQWLAAQPATPTDYLARRIIASVRAGQDASADVSALLNLRDSNGGWGGESGYLYNILDTALALQALKAAGYSDPTLIGRSLTFLGSSQKTDGGWGFAKNGPNNTYVTAVVANTLAQFRDTYPVHSSMERAIGYLLSKQNPDGGFGSSPSTVYETALAVEALAAAGELNVQRIQAGTAGLQYLGSQQQENGSWGSDPFSTALALKALAQAKPDLATQTGDIRVSTTSPLEGEPFTLTAMVRNLGLDPVATALVRLLDGDAVVGEKTIINLAPGGGTEVPFTFTLASTGDHDLKVVLDPQESLPELREDNNSRSFRVWAAGRPELILLPEFLDFDPAAPHPGEPVTLTAWVANLGETAVPQVSADLYDGDPAAGGVKLGSFTFLGLVAGGWQSQTLTFTLDEPGEHALYLVLDPENVISEGDETNNSATHLLSVTQAADNSVDLAIPPAGLRLDPARPSAGQTARINVQVLNQGGGKAEALVEVFDGPADAGGVLLHQESLILNAGELMTVEIPWQVPGGVHTLYAYVDRSGSVAETDEGNNWQALPVMADMVDIEISAADLAIQPGQPMAGDQATVTVTVHNRGIAPTGPFSVALYNGDPAASGVLLQTFQVADLAGDGVQTFTHTFTAERGDYRFQAVCDPDHRVAELFEDNNTAIRSLSVKTSGDAKGPDLVPVEMDLSGTRQDPQSLNIEGAALVKVQNKGDDKVVDPFRVLIFEDRNGDGLYSATADNALGSFDYAQPMWPNGVALAPVPVKGTLTFRDAPVYVLVDSGQTVFEQNEDNNLMRRGSDCEARPVLPIEPVVEWSMQGGIYVPPAILNFTDDNGDGSIDEKDVPDIVVVDSFLSNSIKVLSGDAGRSHFDIPNGGVFGVYPFIASGDIDNDGFPEIIMPRRASGGSGILAFEHDGTLKWDNQSQVKAWALANPQSPPTIHEAGIPVITDIDADGSAEIIMGITIINQDGTIRSVAKRTYDQKTGIASGVGTFNGNWSYTSAVTDMDMDGILEFLAGNAAYKNSGEVMWFNGSLTDGINAVGNLDEDDFPEIVLVTWMAQPPHPVSARLYLLEHDGAVKWGPVYLKEIEGATSSVPGGPPVIADFDGDGEREIGVKGFNKYYVFDKNGNMEISYSVPYGSGGFYSAPTVFDLNGDGRPEVLINSDNYFRIFDGRSGTTIYEDKFGGLWNSYQNVVIADVDGDNQTEIVAIGRDLYGGTYDGIRVYGAKNNDWVNTRRIWNQPTYHVTNVNDDGTIPRYEAPSWLLNNSYRANVPVAAPAESNPYLSPDLTASFVRVGMADYPPSATITARIGNGGSKAVEPGTSVAFYDGDPASGGMLIGTASTTKTLNPGDFEDISLLWTDPTEGNHSIFVHADADAAGAGMVDECDESNNLVSVSAGIQRKYTEIDLTIPPGGLLMAPLRPLAGRTVTLQTQILNQGRDAATAMLEIHVDEISEDTLIHREEIDLRGGEFRALEIPWQVPAGIHTLHAHIDRDNLIAETDESNNTQALPVMADMVDIEISAADIVIDPAYPMAGDQVAVTVTVHNRGIAPTGPFGVALYNGDPASGATLLQTFPVADLAGDGAQTVSHTFSAERGNYHFHVICDPDDQVTELFEGNNTAIRSLSVKTSEEAKGPDLVPVELDLSGTEQDPQTLSFDGAVLVKVQNKGNDKVIDPFRVLIFEDRDGDGLYAAGRDRVLGFRDHAQPMWPNGVALVPVPVSGTLTFRDAPLYVLVDSGQMVFEQNEDNNLMRRGSECEARLALPIEPVVTWKWRGTAEGIRDVSASPLVANLTDDNGDGRIDEHDIPDLLVVGTKYYPSPYNGTLIPGGALVALDGATGRKIFSYFDMDHMITSGSLLATGDLDQDGLPEIVATRTNYDAAGLLVFEHDGTLKWDNKDQTRQWATTRGWYPNYVWAGPVFADLDVDGQPEIVTGATVTNSDGTIRWVAPPVIDGYYTSTGSWTGGSLSNSVVADVDLDGLSEIVAGNMAYNHDGSIKWWNKTITDGLTAIGNLDDDIFPEIVLMTIRANPTVTGPRVYVLEHDGTVKWGPLYLRTLEGTNTASQGSPPVIADFDGDGQVEIGVKGFVEFFVLNADGEEEARYELPYYSDGTLNSPAVFDLNGDVHPEIIFNAEHFLRIFDGNNKTLVYQEPFGSAWHGQNVIVADLDHDHQAEIIATGYGWDGTQDAVRVYGAKNNDWVDARRIWNQNTYHVTNVNDDGTIPRYEAPSWLMNNSYRTNVPVTAPADSNPNISADLSASFVRVNMTEYPHAVKIQVRVGNGGAKAAAAGIPVAFFDGDPESGGTLIGTATTSVELAPGQYEDVSLAWTSPKAGSHSLFIRADHDGLVADCDKANNETNLEIVLQEEAGSSRFADLSMVPADIETPAGAPEGSLAPVRITVHNLGNVVAENALLHLFVGNPDESGMPIGSHQISRLIAGGSVTVDFAWNTLGFIGRNYLYAVVDAAGSVAESNEGNNLALKEVEIVSAVKPDLQIGITDITVAPSMPREGDTLAVTAVVHNRGTPAGNVKVALYDGDPAVGGIELSTATVAALIPMGGSAAVSFSLDTVGLAGARTLVVVLDPDLAVDESDETNNRAAYEVVLGAAGIDLALSTDRSEYEADGDLLITLTFTEKTSTARSLGYQLVVEDQGGNQVAAVAAETALARNANATLAVAAQWNTGSTFAGSYRLLARATEEGRVVAKASVPFTILPQKVVTAAVAADRISYGANETVALTAAVTSQSVNYFFSGLTATFSITDPQGEEIFAASRPIANLTPGQRVQTMTNWNTGTVPKGAYTVRVKFSEGEELLGTAESTFEILGSAVSGAGILGSLSVEPDAIEYGDSALLRYAVSNRGNEELSGHALLLLIVDPDTQELVSEVRITADQPLPAGNSQSGESALATDGMGLKNFLAVLQLEIGELRQGLASAVFRVKDETPPALSVLSPLGGETYRTGVPVTAQATDLPSGIDRVEYRLDEQENWTPLTPADTADLYSAFWETTFENDGPHTIVVRTLDKAGNQTVSAPVAFEVLTDSTPPETRLEIGEPQFQASNRPVYVTAATSITLSATDDLSGVEATNYRLDEEPEWRNYYDAFNLSDLGFGPHTIYFRSFDNAGNEEVEKSVQIILIGIEVDSEILNLPRVLVWTEDPARIGGKERPAYTLVDVENLMADAFAGEAYFQLVSDKDLFQAAFHSGIYNVVMILDQDIPFDAGFLREMREAVNQGMGLLVSSWGNSVHPILQEMFGVDFRGSLAMNESDRTLHLYGSPLGPEQLLTVRGRILRTLLDGGTLAGIIPGESACAGIKGLTLHYPMEIRHGDRVTVSLSALQGKKLVLIDEEHLTVESPAAAPVNNAGPPDGDIAIAAISENGIFLSLAAPYGYLGEFYSLTVRVERSDGTALTADPVQIAPTCTANLRPGLAVGPFTLSAVDEDRVRVSEDVPAAVLNRYGEGRTVFLAYSLVGSAVSDAPEHAALLRNAAIWLLPPLAGPEVGQLALLQTTIRSQGAEIELKAEEILDEGIMHRPLFDLTKAPLEYQFSLIAGETVRYRYFVEFSDKRAEYGKRTSIFLRLDDDYVPFDRYSFHFTSGAESESPPQ